MLLPGLINVYGHSLGHVQLEIRAPALVLVVRPVGLLASRAAVEGRRELVLEAASALRERERALRLRHAAAGARPRQAAHRARHGRLHWCRENQTLILLNPFQVSK